jgi:peptidyl-prolyl cis-trans isomerase SurA
MNDHRKTIARRARRRQLLSATMLLLPLLVTAIPARQLFDRVVARVNGEIITENEVFLRAFGTLNRDGRMLPGTLPDMRAVLEDMIDERLLGQAAGEEIEEVPGEIITNRVEDSVKRLIASVGSREEFEAELKKRGWDLQSYKRFLREQEERAYRIRTALARRVRMTRDDVEAFRRKLQEEGKSVLQYRLQQILVALPEAATAEQTREAEKKVLDLLERIRKGEPFEDLAAKFSDDPVAAKTGGDIGWIGEHDLDPRILAAVHGLETDKVAQPVRTGKGIHIFRLAGKRGAEEQLFDRLLVEAHDKWVDELRRKGQITIYLNETPRAAE